MEQDSNDEWTEEDFSADKALTPQGILYEKPKAKHMFVAIFLAFLCLALSSVYWFFPEYANVLWASRHSVFLRHQYWRIFTAIFVHADLKHLLSNMPLWLIFGWFLRSYFGLLAFPVAALLIGALTNAVTLFFYDDHIRLIGASGVVYGIIGLWLVFYFRYESRYSFFVKLIRVTGFSLIFLLPTTYSPTTSYLAHGFGFLFGMIGAFLLIVFGNYDAEQKALQTK